MATLRAPDVVPSPSQDALTLKQALKGFGTDEKEVIKVLGYRNASQRSKIKDAYQQLYKRSLIDDLRSQLSGDFGKAVELWMHDPPERDAKLIHNALKRHREGSLISKHLEVIVEIACTTSPDHLVAVRQAYSSLFGCSVEQDISSHLSLPFRKLLVDLVISNIDDMEVVDTNIAEMEATKLHEAIGEKQFDQDQLFWILSTGNVYQLQETFKQYKKNYGRPIYEDLTYKDGNLAKMVICCIESPEKHFAKVVRDSITSFGTDEDSLSRVIVTRAEVDMANIIGEYFDMYKSRLDDAVAGDTSGDYKDFLMALLGAKIVRK